MKTITTLIAMISLITATSFAGTVNFDDARPGAAPAGWTATKTGDGEPKWTVEKDATAPSGTNVLKQSGVATYPVCIKDDTSLKDGFVKVHFKTVSGKDDQAGGVLWRAQDADNYYVARANALEHNVCIYYTIKGRRSEQKRVAVIVSPNEWHSLRVDFSGSHFTVTLDGNKMLEWDDDTFKEAGQVGVWTKADSVTLFDDFSYGSK